MKIDGRSNDLTFSWMLTSLGPEWSEWQKLAAEWMSTQKEGVAPKQVSLTRFFESYLYKVAPYSANIELFFKGHNGHRCSTTEFEKIIRQTVNQALAIQRAIGQPSEFLDYVIEKHFSAQNEKGLRVPLVTNPLTKIKINNSVVETVRNALPYRYVQELRNILCPPIKPARSNRLEGQDFLKEQHFKHWKWAHNTKSDWFEIDPCTLDKTDPDCVWRTKKVVRNGKVATIYQIWSPVKATIIFMKLHLPLRTYQIRMLDSGEADTWRYEKGKWRLNNRHKFALGSEKKPYSRGVFRRIYDFTTGVYSTGLYINTNKTADRHKNDLEKGYTIPWQHKEILYWLEKLRNWQEKYNPIPHPTDCTTLQNKHTDQKKSQYQLKNMGEISFLFRDASSSGEDKFKPIYDKSVRRLWQSLLNQLEIVLDKRGEKLENGERITFSKSEDSGTTQFPLHSLRVSLITAYTMDTSLPLPVISKILAGHSRMLMTIYYNKISPSVFSEKMKLAERELYKSSESSVKNFLKDASMENIKNTLVYNQTESLEAALVNRNPIGWEERGLGLCLVGGNTVRVDETKTLGGCWNGGEILKDDSNALKRIYSPVPHGPENCVRCRWFITEARYLPALNARFNLLSFKAHQAANLSLELESLLEQLKDEQFFCVENGEYFTKKAKLLETQRRFEKQQTEADEYTKDLIACFGLIGKINNIEESRSEKDNRDKFIAIGSEKDVKHAVDLIETKSELLHISLLCEDAEFYPDLRDELIKTSAIQKRTMHISRALMKRGMKPVFLEMGANEQLIACNALMRYMAKASDPNNKFEGFRKAANYIEAGEYLSDSKLLNKALESMNNKSHKLIS